MSFVNPNKDWAFIHSDRDLMDVLECANPAERIEFLKILREGELGAYGEQDLFPANLADNFQHQGGHGLANKWRGHGPPYKEIVNDVASILKVDGIKHNTVIAREFEIIRHVVAKVEGQLTAESKHRLLGDISDLLHIDAQRPLAEQLENLSPGVISLLLKLAAPRHPHHEPIESHLAAIAGGLLIGFGGPLGWATGLTLASLAFTGPATRIITSGVVYIALLRLQQRTQHIKGYIGGAV